MKNQITLNEDTIIKLQQLYNQIDEENNKSVNKCNIDTITFNQYKILDMIKELVFSKPENNTTKMKVVNIKIPLYDYDDEDNVTPLDDETCEDIYEEISSEGEVCGYCIHEISLDEEYVEI